MANHFRQSGDEALPRRTLLVGATAGMVAAVASAGPTLAREAGSGRRSAALVAARASDVLVELLTASPSANGQTLFLRITNAGSLPVAIGPGMMRALPPTDDATPLGAPADLCALAAGASTHLTITIPNATDEPIEAVEIGIIEANRSGATVRLGLEPLRADARGGDALSSVRTDSNGSDHRSPESFPACPH